MTKMKGTLGQVLINAALPEQYRMTGPVTKKTLAGNMLEYVRDDPEGYARTIPEVKQLGDEFATFEGISVGLDDIAPEYKKRDAIFKKVRTKFWNTAHGSDAAVKILRDTQDKIQSLTAGHPGDMGLMARSGGRGNMNQLMKAVGSPVIVGNFDGTPNPFMIERGYSEGLSPAEAWIAGDESRGQIIKGQLGTADPGDLGKIMASMMSAQVVAGEDCGTTNGIMMDADDVHILGRYLAGPNTLVTSRERQRIMRAGSRVKVRSPMTCELPRGVCRFCRGTEPDGKLPDIGTNVGIRSAQALSEPLVQMQLSSKHGVSLVAGETEGPTGLTAVRQFLEVPSSFFSKATLADHDGKVDRVDVAPQGGFNVYVGASEHYVPPGRSIKVSKGQKVEAGDILSSGVPAPNEVVRHKGLGAGRRYLADAFHGVYADAGIGMDKRHLETLVKSQLNSVRVVDKIPGFLPGDVVPYQDVVSSLRGAVVSTPIAKAKGLYLGQAALHHVPGTPINGGMVKDFKEAGLASVGTLESMPKVEAVMLSASRTPLLNPNWMQRLGHRYQKATLLQAAQQGELADLHSHDPTPGLVVGREYRRGPGGTY